MASGLTSLGAQLLHRILHFPSAAVAFQVTLRCKTPEYYLANLIVDEEQRTLLRKDLNEIARQHLSLADRADRMFAIAQSHRNGDVLSHFLSDTPDARTVLRKMLAGAPVLLNCSPSLHKYSILGFDLQGIHDPSDIPLFDPQSGFWPQEYCLLPSDMRWVSAWISMAIRWNTFSCCHFRHQACAKRLIECA